MESTSIYWIPIWCVLSPHFTLLLVNNAEIVRKVSKVDGVLQRCNIRLSNYVSNIECKSYCDVVRRLSEGVTNPNKLMKLVHGRIVNRHGAETILASLTGVVS